MALTIGQQVTWMQSLRGGWGYVQPVNGTVLKIGASKVTIAVAKRDGTVAHVAVTPASLRDR